MMVFHHHWHFQRLQRFTTIIPSRCYQAPVGTVEQSIHTAASGFEKAKEETGENRVLNPQNNEERTRDVLSLSRLRLIEIDCMSIRWMKKAAGSLFHELLIYDIKQRP